MKNVKYALIASMMLGITSLYAAAAAGAGVTEPGVVTGSAAASSAWALSTAGTALMDAMAGDVPAEAIRKALEEATVGDVGEISGHLHTMKANRERNADLTSPAIRTPWADYEAAMAAEGKPRRIMLAAGQDVRWSKGEEPKEGKRFPDWYTVDLVTYGECLPDAVLDINNLMLMQYFPDNWADEVESDDYRFVRDDCAVALLRILKPGKTFALKAGGETGLMGMSFNGGSEIGYDIAENGRGVWPKTSQTQTKFRHDPEFRAEVYAAALARANEFYRAKGASKVEFNDKGQFVVTK